MSVAVADVLARVADLEKVAGPSALEPYWTEICTDALASGQADVYGALAARGFTPDVVTTWPDLDAFVLDQAVFWALTRGGALEAFDQQALKQMDRREQLKTVGLTDQQRNVRGAAGSVGRGKINNPADDHDPFVRPDGTFRRW